MIKQLKLKNFKCFNDEVISFKPLTILAGANASGKSSVMQALLLAYHTSKEGVKPGDTLDINKPYNMNLGKATNLRSHEPVEPADTIEIGLSLELNEIRENRLVFRFDHIGGSISIKSELADTYEIGLHSLDYLNAERIGPRKYTNISDDPFFIGYHGEYVSYVIEQADLRGYEIKNELIIEEQSKHRFSAQVEAWLSIIIDNTRLQFSNNSDFGLMQNYMQNTISKEPVLPTATGFGLSYALPIVTAGLLVSGKTNPILLIENPEAHLHPSAQSNIGKFLGFIAMSGIQVIVETHSEHIVDGARIQLAKEKQHEKLKIVFFEADVGKVKANDIELKQNGELTDWPKGFMDQRQMDLRELLEIKRNAHN